MNLINRGIHEVVSRGTGRVAGRYGVEVAGKTGTAQNPAGEDHVWFVGFAPAENPEIAFAVLLENAGGGGKALTLTKSVLEYYFDQ
jgi:cell division protein FtsI/penicillin-binding protein 2